MKRELENIGAGDDQTMRARTELAVCVYLDFQREFQRMKLEHRTLVGKLAEAKQTYGELQDVEIAEAEVLSLLYGDPVYHDLQPPRESAIEPAPYQHGWTRNDATARAGPDPGGVECDEAQLQELEDHARDLVRGAKRIALKAEISHLESQVNIAAGQAALLRKRLRREPTMPTPRAVSRSVRKWRSPMWKTSSGSSIAWPKNRNASAWNSTPSPA